MTTFSRLALVIQGKIKPCNWIERAFAALVASISGVLPSVSTSDRGKFLGVNASNNNLGWKAIRQVPEVENADKGKFLHNDSSTGELDWSSVNEVPAVENADKGKYLKANDSTGALEWSEASSGTAIFEGTLVTNVFTPNNWDFDDIASAVENGMVPVVITVSQEDDTEYKNVLYLTYQESEDNESTVFNFAKSDCYVDSIISRTLEVSPQGYFSYYEYTYSISPTT